jgi:hypothetical protein
MATVQERVYVVLALFSKENRFLIHNDVTRIPPGNKKGKVTPKQAYVALRDPSG